MGTGASLAWISTALKRARRGDIAAKAARIHAALRGEQLGQPELMDLLQAAGGVLAATGSAVSLCSTYGWSDTAAVTG